MTSSDAPSYKRAHIGSTRDFISDALVAARRERRLRIVEKLAPVIARGLESVDPERYAEFAPQCRALVDMLEAIAEPEQTPPRAIVGDM